jgi:hypothetical protein
LECISTIEPTDYDRIARISSATLKIKLQAIAPQDLMLFQLESIHGIGVSPGEEVLGLPQPGTIYPGARHRSAAAGSAAAPATSACSPA